MSPTSANQGFCSRPGPWSRALRTISSPDGGPAQGTMDVKMIPNDPRGYGYTVGMFDGHIYLIDPVYGTATPAFDCDTVTPHVDTPVQGGMGQILAIPRQGNRLIF